MEQKIIDVVYRAARNKNWVRGNTIGQNAFFRRPPDSGHPDTTGLSVDLSLEAAKIRAERQYRTNIIIEIDVAKLRGYGLRVVPYGDHGNICDVPFYERATMSEALAWADAIIQCCTGIIRDWEV